MTSCGPLVTSGLFQRWSNEGQVEEEEDEEAEAQEEEDEGKVQVGGQPRVPGADKLQHHE